MKVDKNNGGSHSLSANASDMVAPAHADLPVELPISGDRATTIVDPAILSELENVIPLSKLEQIIRLYLIDVELHLARIVEARANRDFPKIDCEAHSLAEMAEKLGAVRVCAAARHLGLACQDGYRASVYQLIGTLNEACAAVADFLRFWIADRRALCDRPAAPRIWGPF